MDERNEIDTTENRYEEQTDSVGENDRPVADIDPGDGTRPISTYRLDAAHEKITSPHTSDDESNREEADNEETVGVQNAVSAEMSTEVEMTNITITDVESNNAEPDDVDSNDADSNDVESTDEEKPKKKTKKPGMVRWGYLVPRAAMLAIAISLVWVLLNPILRIALIKAGQAAVGAKVEIESLSTSLTDTLIELRGLAVADPDHEMKNLVEIDEMRLDLNAIDLLKKKLVVSDASISGIRLSSDRTTSGFLEEEEETVDESADETVEEETAKPAVPQWITGQLDAIQCDAQEQLARFESIQLAEQLGAEWPLAYEDLRNRADSIQTRALSLRQLYEQRQGVRNDPQAAVQLVQQAGGELGTLQAEAQEIIRKLEELKVRFEQDKQKVVELGRADLAELNQMATEAGVGPRELTEMLIGDMISSRVKNAATWIAYIKRLMPDKEKSLAKARTKRVGGVDIEFPITDKKPPLLIERMAIDGILPIGGVDYQFAGEIRDVTSNPSLLNRPIECELAFNGPAAYNMHLTVDATGDVLRQHLIVSCPNLQLDRQTLGRADRLAIDVEPGRMEIGADIVVEGDEIVGTIITRQSGAQLTMATREDTVIGRWNPRLQQLVDSIRSIDTRVDLAGTLKKPQVAIESNLGDSLASGLRTAVTAELTARRDQLIQLTQDKINGQLTSLDRLVAAKRAEIEDRIRLDESKLGPVAKLLGGDGQDLIGQLIGGAGGQLQNQAMGAIQNATGGAVGNAIGGATQGILSNLPGMQPNRSTQSGGTATSPYTTGVQSRIPGLPGIPGLQSMTAPNPSGQGATYSPPTSQTAPAYGSPVTAPYGTSNGQMNPGATPTAPYTPYPNSTQAGYSPQPQQPATTPVGVPATNPAPTANPGIPNLPYRTGNLPYGDLIPR